MSDVLVLCYHAVSDRWPTELAVGAAALEAQLQSLLERGYRPVTFSEAVASHPSDRVVAVTFDDGFRSVVDAALPVLSRHGVAGTVFVCTDFVDSGERMSWEGISQWFDGPSADELTPVSWDDLATLRVAGWEIGSHTRTHPYLTTLDDAALDRELRLSRLRLSEVLGEECRSLAYPYGDFDARVVAAAAAAGYTAACGLPPRPTAPLPLSWPRVGVYREDGPLSFRVKSSQTVRRLRGRPGGARLDRLYRAWAHRRADTRREPGEARSS